MYLSNTIVHRWSQLHFLKLLSVKMQILCNDLKETVRRNSTYLETNRTLFHSLTSAWSNSKTNEFKTQIVSHRSYLPHTAADAVTQSLTNKSQSWCDLGIRENCLILSSPQLPVNDQKYFLKTRYFIKSRLLLQVVLIKIKNQLLYVIDTLEILLPEYLELCFNPLIY